MSSELLRICTEPIDLASVYQALSDPACGAQLVFTGTVRKENEGRSVKAVTYEIFEALALQVLAAIVHEARTKVDSPLRIVIVHRVGTLSVGEVSVAIGVASPHRSESYEVSRFLIEQIKTRVPIWKEEHYIDGGGSWLDGAALVAKN